MGAGCKFVHADVDYTLLEGHPIHVNYIWRHEGLCAYERLPPGELVEVLSDDMSTVNSVRSELILVTRGALARFDIAEPLIRCKYFDLNQTCFTGERCNFLHIISVDPTAQGDFKRTSRATAVSGAPTGSSLTHPNEGSAGTCSTRTTNKEDSTTTKTMCGAGNQDTRPSSSSWVPNPDLAPFEPSTAKQYATPQDVVTPSGLPPNALQDQLRRNDTYLHGIPGMATSVLNNYLQDMQTIPGVPGFERAATPQEQLNYLISQLVPVIVDQLSARSARTITVAPSPLLDVPSSIGTLLFLPRGVSEAVAVHPVLDTSFLCRVMMLGAEAGYSVSAADRQQQAMRMGGGTGWWQPHGVQGGCSGDAFPANWSNIR
uniref:C3H1-type domain-containing protein n=1 Tax=Trypanosoma congolense (strain IL3000) TaxID=1068625 RepID=G0UY39_TRYCI|nr:conserved hypothetical protein [Trypanosoma congolense IL3000]